MKRLLFYCLITFCLSSVARATSVGDVTGDGQVDIADVNAVINAMLGKAASAEQQAASDVTGDGLVDIADVNAVINAMLGKVQPLDALAQLEADMVRVEGGTFDMGTPADAAAPCAHAWERPVHQVTLPSFMVCKHEVTQALWQAVMGSNPSTFRGERRPVETVSWHDAQMFVQRLVEKTGKPYRLLTEAEWEYAARGGAHHSDALYAGGDDLAQVAWYSANAAGETHPVGQLQPNALGLYDMSGNVLEWVEDTHADVYAAWPAANQYVVEGRDPVVRGGSWRWGGNYCRVGYRGYFPATASNSYLGLRLACDMTPLD
ncbi:MAG: SUMF1/EgtB/PvdO family nonheme iron enzyme [Muribaculaceae bacterium]|nr:SUMF1/EgtB/PvdO family nonheme iron enzyme [Muribaculaceae bacterium]